MSRSRSSPGGTHFTKAWAVVGSGAEGGVGATSGDPGTAAAWHRNKARPPSPIPRCGRLPELGAAPRPPPLRCNLRPAAAANDGDGFAPTATIPQLVACSSSVFQGLGSARLVHSASLPRICSDSAQDFSDLLRTDDEISSVSRRETRHVWSL